MITNVKTKIFETERNNTDESLDAEREKTNDSIIGAQLKTEADTDRRVKQKRSEVDEATTTARNVADATVDPGDPNELAAERKLADQSVEIERSHMDKVMDRERDEKNEIVALLLNQERDQTDESLSIERSEADSEVIRASGRLSSEVAEHLKTKSTLTSREDFLAIVSHDLRNPIGAASSCVDMLLEDSNFADMSPEALKTWLELIKRNVDSSLRLISDLLDMERIAKDKIQLNIQRHQIDSIIRESMESHTYQASAKTILIKNSSPKIASDIFCDRDRIMQVLSNLIGNAIKFTPEGGTVTLGTEVKKDGIQICIRDTGPGIAQDKQAAVFERFKQVKSGEGKGLGLGLYISKNLIESHKGHIWVESKEGGGCTFLFFIPNKRT